MNTGLGLPRVRRVGWGALRDRGGFAGGCGSPTAVCALPELHTGCPDSSGRSSTVAFHHRSRDLNKERGSADRGWRRRIPDRCLRAVVDSGRRGHTSRGDPLLRAGKSAGPPCVVPASPRGRCAEQRHLCPPWLVLMTTVLLRRRNGWALGAGGTVASRVCPWRLVGSFRARAGGRGDRRRACLAWPVFPATSNRESCTVG
jgi:hypothetical protein